VGWWKGDGTAMDVLNANNGALVGGTTYAPGEVAQAFQFSATGDQVSVPTGGFPIGTNDRTIECWVYINSFIPGEGANFAFYGSSGIDGGSYSLGAYSDQRLFCSQWGSGIFGPVLTTNQWYHVAVTSEGTNTTLYLNGTNVGSGYLPFNTPADSQLFIGGIYYPFATYQMIGLIDEVSIYNRALSSNEISAIYNAGSAGKCLDNCTPPPADIISWWPAEGNAIDQTGSNNGSLVGPVSFTNGEVGQGFNFDGASSYVLIPNSPSLNPAGAFSIEGWIYLTNDVPQSMILSKWGDRGDYGDNRSYVLSTVSGLGLLFSISDLANQENNAFQQITANDVLTLNAWTHVAATYDSTTGIRNLYVNGTNVLSNTNTPVAVYASITPVTIGAWLRGPGDIEGYFPGLIDEVSLYGRALSDSEIRAIYNAGSGGKCNFHPYIPPPRTATGTAEWAGAFVVGVDITDGGAGYTNTPNVRFIGGGGTGAQASVVVSNGVVVAIDITNPGSGYTNTPVVVIDPPFISNPVLGIASISILNFSNLLVGTNYQLQQFPSTTWINQSASFKATNSFYTTMVSGVANSDSYRLAQIPVPVQATAFAQVVNGFVVNVLVNNPGSGYVIVPTVAIIANVGSNATAVASINNGRVTSIAVTSAGIHYVNPVTVQIDPPPVTAISPAVTSGVVINSSSLAPYDNYQILFRPDFGNSWGNLSGGLFSPTATTNSQYIFLTNDIGFFRLQYVP
jgi:hypothetical protein